MKPLYLLVVAMLCCSSPNVNAQCDNTPQPDVLDGIVVKAEIPTKPVVQYPYLRESDLMWSKRVWWTIDLREKLNHPLYYPEEELSDRKALWHVIKNAALCEGLTLYNPYFFDDQFRYPVTTYDEKLAMVANIDTAWEYDPFGNPVYDVNGDHKWHWDSTWIESYEIIEYHIKEDWFFDDERSVMDVRIIGIAPVVYDKDQFGEIRAKKELFWVYFPELRYYIQNEFVYNAGNDAQWMSFDDLFWKRMFSSYIYKESNVYDRKINQYQTGVDALLESDRIKDELFTIEHDVWHF